MRRARLLTILFIFATLPSAYAGDEPESYVANSADPIYGTSGKSKIFIIHKEECLSTLNSLLSPEAKIKSGMEALSAVNDSSGAAERFSCLGDLVQNWDSEIPAPDLPAVPAVESYNFGGPYQKDLVALQKKLQCVNPYSDSVNHEYFESHFASPCGGKTLPASEKPALQAKYDEIYQKANQFHANKQLLNLVPSLLSHKQQKLKAIVAQYHEVEQNNQCINPYPEGTDGYKSYATYGYNGHSCQGHWGKPEEKAKNEQLLQELSNQYMKLQSEPEENASGYQAIFSDPNFSAVIDMEALLPIIKKMNCQNGNSNGWGMGGDCAGKVLSAEEIDALREELQAKLPKLSEAQVKLAEMRAKDNAERDLVLKKIDEIQAPRYKLRRLLARYRGFVKTGGEAANLDGFCAGFEALQRRDKKFAESGLTISQFSGAMPWKYATEYGFTEAEMTALQEYVGSYYNVINRAIHEQTPSGKSLTPELELYKQVLDQGLDRMPGFTGGPLKRHTKLPETERAKHVVGAIVTYDAYTSTTKNTNWGWSGTDLFVIYGAKNAKDISDYNSGEEEVLFRSGTKFKVLARDDADGFHNYVLAEVDEQGNVIAELPPELKAGAAH